MPLIDHIIDTYYTPGGTLLRAMAAKLKAGGRISPHVDSLESFHMGHRIHVPITTNAAVRFMIEGKPYKFEVGKAYELNNQKTHSVMNMSKEDRISFIFDYVPPDLNKNA
jgi:aspartyl/asparaginyl beta-hydroxylase (cupin superfamily)